MKKWISLLLAGILVSSVLVGCNKGEDTATDTTGGATAETTGTTPPATTTTGG